MAMHLNGCSDIQIRKTGRWCSDTLRCLDFHQLSSLILSELTQCRGGRRLQAEIQLGSIPVSHGHMPEAVHHVGGPQGLFSAVQFPELVHESFGSGEVPGYVECCHDRTQPWVT